MMLDSDHPGETVLQRLQYALREREIYIRSDGQMRYFIVRPWMLVGLLLSVTAAIGWVGFTTFSFLDKQREIWAANEATNTVRIAYEERVASVQDTIDQLNDRLMIDQGAYMAKVHDLRGEFAELLRRQRRLETFFEQGWIPRRDPEAEGDETADNRDRGETQRESRFEPPVEPEFRSVEQATRPIREANMLFADLVAQQDGLIARIAAYGEERANRLRLIVKRLGLNPRRVAASVETLPDAIGGPLLPVQMGEEPSDVLDERILEAHNRFAEAEKLRIAISRMPITLPIARGYRLTSGFGFRRDPFKNVVAMHQGVDLRAARGTRVRATSGGRVVRAEHADAYGKLVEIRHDNGISTRYAHLSRIDVAVGDRVALHDVIGRVGSTGRSTGPHLHYETRVHGRPIDPYQFIRVAKDVFPQEDE